MNEQAPDDHPVRVFSSQRDEILYLMTLDGVRESNGQVSAPTGRFSIFDLSQNQWAILRQRYEREITAANLTEPFDLVGNFLLIETSDRVIRVQTYPNHTTLIEAYEDLEEQYAQWLLGR